MHDTELYQQLLGLQDPGRVTKVELDSAAGRVDVWVEDRSGAQWSCPECGKQASVYDHSDERVWHHLNTCQFGTYIHCRLSCIRCPEHGVRQVSAPWDEPGSRFTHAKV